MTSTIQSNQVPLVVRLRRGREQRLLRIAIFSTLEEPDRLAPRQVLEAFVNGVEEGLLGKATVTAAKLSAKALKDHGVMVDILTGRFWGAEPQALLVLPHMVAVSVPGAKGLEIVEEYPNERLLLVRTLAPDAEATLADVGFELAFDSAAEPSVRIRFLDPPSSATMERLDGLIHAWTTLVRLGAYPPPNGGPSAADLVETAMAEPCVCLARFTKIACGHAAYEALFGALDQVGDEAPITHLTIGTNTFHVGN